MMNITWDIGIAAALGLLLAYSIIIRKHKALATLMSTYVAYFVAASWGTRLSQLFDGDRVLFNQVLVHGVVTPFTGQAFLLILTTFLMAAFVKLGGKGSRYSVFEVVVYVICTIAVGAMFLTLFMSPDMRATVFEHSKILPFIYQWRDWVLMTPVFVIVYFGLYGDERHE